MDLSYLDGKTGHLLWVAQTFTICAVFAMLWLHKKKRLFLLFFSLGFLSSAIGSVDALLPLERPTAFSFGAIIALCFWNCGAFHAQGRRFQPWLFAPLLIYAVGWLLFSGYSNKFALLLAFHTASVIGHTLLALTILTVEGHRSGTRKVLGILLVTYGLVMCAISIVAFLIGTYDVGTAATISLIHKFVALFGLTLILMLAAKMVISDTECRLTHLALTDHLTNIYNRRALERLFTAHKDATGKNGQFISITMFDIDHFKKINDEYGHAFGDFVLKSFVQLVQKKLRSDDSFIRMGGEEFAVISKIDDLSQASKLAERIRIEFGNLSLNLEGRKMHATVSAGIAAQEVGEADLYRLLSMADRGLYAAKQAGRDRCVIHDENTSVVIPSSLRDPGDEIETYTDKQVAVLKRISAIADAHKVAP